MKFIIIMMIAMYSVNATADNELDRLQNFNTELIELQLSLKSENGFIEVCTPISGLSYDVYQAKIENILSNLWLLESRQLKNLDISDEVAALAKKCAERLEFYSENFETWESLNY